MNKDLIELEQQIEYDFNEDDFENLARKTSISLNNSDDYIKLATICRWAGFSDEQRAIDLACDFVDRAIEICITNNNIQKLEEIIFELEKGMELDERAFEVREIISNLKNFF